MKLKKYFETGLLAAIFFFSGYNLARAQISAHHEGAGGGGVILGASTTACDATIKGAIRYNTATHVPEFCDSSAWRPFVVAGAVTDPSAATAIGDGYFVLTNGTWNGDLYTPGHAADASVTTGTEGANALCLSDLNANNWVGKATASSRGLLNSTHVMAFLCSTRMQCQGTQASTRYYFAKSGDMAAGGAYFDSSADALGPNDSADWSGATYFNGSYTYHTGRSSGANTLWANDPFSSSSDCLGWTSSAGANGTRYGSSASTLAARWNTAGNVCSGSYHLICIVQPFP